MHPWDDDPDWGFDDLYDPDELAAIEAGARWGHDGAVSRRDVSPPSNRVSRFSRGTAVGAVLTGLALGLQEVFDPEDRREIVVEVDATGEPGELPVQMLLDPDSPTGSLCIVQRDHLTPPVL